jgi:beta-lactamase regulating signal transducer with metallopeptidase domain
MISYLIKSGLCLVLVLLVYKVLLERERMYVFNRYYLLFGLCFSFVVPFIPMVSSLTIPIVESNPVLFIDNTEALPIAVSPQEVSNVISWFFYMLSLYAIGSLFFVSRFITNLYKISQKIIKNTRTFYKKASLVLLKENIVPHTFLHYIFIDKEAYNTSTIADELYTHELAHVTQKHTVDIILIELIQIIFWFNPLLIYYKKAIQLNHEFLADDAVLKSNIQVPAYQQLLLDNASWNHNLYLASNLNFSVTKKRLQMMTKQTSRVRAWLFASLTIPLFIGALFLFSTKVVAQEATAELIETTKTLTLIEQERKDPKEYYYKNVTFIFEDADGNKVIKKYAELTSKEKENLRQPPKTPVAKRPTAKLLNDWKDKKGFAIWVDGKVIDNSQISNYDIAHYTGSFVHKNARSKRFPQLYQMSLYTSFGFEGFKREITNPLGKRTIIHSKEGSHKKPMGKKKVNAKKETKTVQQELAEINKLALHYVNEKNGSNEIEIPTKVGKTTNGSKKDIVVMITKEGEFLVNYELKSDFNGLDGNIKAELGKILHKRSRSSLIIYHVDQRQFIEKVTSVLKSNKIYNVETIDMESIPPPPPPVPKISSKEKADAARMLKNIKGHTVKTMIINGKQYSYVVKNGRKFIYNDRGQLIDENGKLLPPPPPVPAPEKPKLKSK